MEQYFTTSFINKNVKNNKLSVIILILLFVQIFINFIGALGPELGFDALWYHLTLARLYVINHTVMHIPGGLLYYSEMPRLTEMLYTAALGLGNEILAKIIHFSFGILATVALYELSRLFFNKKLSLLVCLIFYSNLVVSWESITAYIDLSRTFFEVMALWGFILWTKTKDRKMLMESGAMLGLAISTKLITFGSLAIFLTFLYILAKKEKQTFKDFLSQFFLFVMPVITISIPWFIISFINTSNPFYPVFTNYETHQSFYTLIKPLNIISAFWNIFTHSPDPLTPIYMIAFPLLLFTLFQQKILRKETFFIWFYCLLGLVVWYITPQSGGGRFILPYLPAFSIIVVVIFINTHLKRFYIPLYCCIFLIAFITIFYRGVANAKYIPVIFEKETKANFLSNHLNFSFGDFYDIDGYLKNHIKTTDKVLTYGIHNLYYIDFPFVDASWIQKGDKFNYILIQNGRLPKRFSSWYIAYSNNKTHVTLYSIGGQTWYY